MHPQAPDVRNETLHLLSSPLVPRPREHLLVAEVANTVIAAAMRGHGGGSQGHLKKCVRA